MKKNKKMAKGKNRLAPPVTSSDLVLTLNDGVLQTTISPDAEWMGIQKFVDMTTNDGAVSILNRNYTGTQAPPKEVCLAQGVGFYRSWSSDKNYDVHLSNVIQIQ